jgi:HSP20 family molecular chaperone IbpA
MTDTNFVTEAKKQLLVSGEISHEDFREMSVAEFSRVLQLAQKLKEEKQ